MSDDIRLIRVARENHLATNGILSGRNGYLFTIFTDYQFARFLPHHAIRPEHEGNYSAFESLLAQARTQIVGEVTNGGATFCSIRGGVPAQAPILRARWRIVDRDTR